MHKNITVKQIGQIVLQARKRQHLTQIQLAAVCGVGVRFIRELEHGKESCHLGKTLQVLQSLGVEVIFER